MSRTIGTFKYPSALPLVTALAATLLGLFGLPQPAAHARAYTYGTGAQRTVNAGILLLDGNTSSHSVGSENKDPYVFYVLNQRTDIKPYGWNIVNPVAPGAVTPEIQSRWDSRTGNTTAGAALISANGGHAYQLGQTITPAMAAYWEVPLSNTRIDNLKQFDVLLVNIDGPCSFTAADAEKLRRFVDGGGTLWVENSSFSGGGIAADPNANPYGPLFFSLQFSGSTPNNAYGLFSYLTRSPIITSPYYLSQTEMNGLGDKHIGNYGITDGNGNLPGPNLLSSVLASSLSTQPVIAAGQYGAGQIIVTNTGTANTISQYAGGVNVYGNGELSGNSGPYSGTNLNLAPTNDLKLLANILAAADAHPQALQNSHQNGSTTDPISSPTQIWKDTDPTHIGGTPTGAAVYGSLAYVTMNGVLYAYYIHPAQDPNPSVSLQQGNPFDIKWSASVGANASAPTVATVPTPSGGSQTLVFVEKPDGTVVGYDAAPPTAAAILRTTLTGSANRGSYTQPAPAPTYFESSIYAGGADGSLFVFNFNSGHGTTGGVSYPVTSAANATPIPVTASPTVGIIPDGDGGNGNEIIALVTTNQYIYSVYLGARGERLGGSGGSYTAKLTGGAKLDTTTLPIPYGLKNDGTRTVVTGAVPNATQNGFTGGPTPATDPLYVDYDTAFSVVGNPGSPVTGGSLTRVALGVVSANAAQSYPNAMISAPALDRAGNAYYIGNVVGAASRLYSYHDAPGSGKTLNWCFQLPHTSDPLGSVVDADGTDYVNTALPVGTGTKNASLAGFQFVGAPVSDGQGNVYALATNGTQAAVLCFNALAGVSADLFGQGLEGPTSGVQIVQPDPSDTTKDLFGNGPPLNNITGGQVVIGPTGHIDFKNFGTTGTAGGVASGFYPNLAEPYPVAVQYNVGDTNQAGNQTPPQQTYARMHTNLSWYTISDRGVSTDGGLTKAGNQLFYANAAGHLEQVVADPQAEGFTITSKFIPVDGAGTSGSTMVTETDTNVGIGTDIATPAVSNGTLVLTGHDGVAVYTNQLTLVTDANRVLEMDSSGNAQWAVDATTRVSLEGDTTPIYSSGNNATGAAGTGQVVTTTLELNRPSSLTELTPNDYLIADTGNNRCVRFDRAGHVIWELTKFNDNIAPAINKTALLLKPGEPDTLNQPTSVQISTTTDAANNVLVQYLISDTGNFRIIEIDDVYNAQGQPLLYHQLAWVSHTHDIQNREYRYQSAAYYYTPSGNYVAALVTNRRIATLANNGLPTDNSTDGTLLPANQDGNGGSIVFLHYNPGGPKPDGFIGVAVSNFVAPLKSDGSFDQATASAVLAGTATPPPPLNMRNPRYLKAYPTPGASLNSPYKNLLLADDNGAWDLQPNTNGTGYSARFGFTQADYRAMTSNGTIETPINATGATANQAYTPRRQFPFTPSSIQLLAGLDVALVSNSNIPLTRYLITNSYSQGEAANAVGSAALGDFAGFSGEVFQVSHLLNGTQVTGGYGGHTLSRPANTSPLNQPTFAYRLQ